MASPNKELPETLTGKELQPLVDQEIYLSLATVPLLLGLLGTVAIAQWLQAVGQASEEVFRGDRLPVRPFPKS